MNDYPCPCDQCNGVGPEDPYEDDFDPLDEGILTWDCSLPETMTTGMWSDQQLWTGVPIPEGSGW